MQMIFLVLLGLGHGVICAVAAVGTVVLKERRMAGAKYTCRMIQNWVKDFLNILPWKGKRVSDSEPGFNIRKKYYSSM